MENQNQERPNLIIKGSFLGVKPAESKGNYTIREFAVDDSYYNSRTGEHVERVFPLSVFGDNCAKLDEFKKGDRVIVRFNLRPGKDSSTGKWKWINVNVWKIEIDAEAQAKTQGHQQPQVVTAVPQVLPVTPAETVEDPDDLPF